MKIEKVTPQDLDQIYDLECKIFKQDSFSKETIGKLIYHNMIFLKLLHSCYSKRIIGFIIIIKQNQNVANLINLLIKKRFRNKGYGSYLLSCAIQKIKEMKEIQKIILNVKTSNKKALNLYHRFNFKIIKEINDYYRNNDNAYLMELQM
jgi:ribosomal-protein-alanine N-acetyltransferase